MLIFKKKKLEDKEYRQWAHYRFVTEEYLDREQAAKKLEEFLKRTASSEKSIMWRAEPAIHWYKDFDSGLTKYYGRARFSVKTETNKEN